jgi:hypothetical protein
MFQYAARYGSTIVADNKLKLASGQTRSSGLNSMTYYENWNEQNRNWNGKRSYFHPYEYAAMTSADYDGHQGTMGNTLGVKNADLNAKLVMGGLVGGPDNIPYLKLMKLWFDNNRTDRKFAADVINVHFYCSTGAYGTGISPEAANMKTELKNIVDYSHANLPNKEVWLTEFGWDTNTYSPFAAPSFEVQGQWTIRGYLAAFAAGVDRTAVYMLRDVSTLPTGWDTSGLTGLKADGYPKKPSWYYVSTMKNRLTGMKYVGEQTSGNFNVTIYKFKSTTGNNGAYVAWCPTSNGTTVNNYQLSLTTSATSSTLVTMQNGDNDGVPSALTISSNKVTVNVSERPIFVLTNNIQ